MSVKPKTAVSPIMFRRGGDDDNSCGAHLVLSGLTAAAPPECRITRRSRVTRVENGFATGVDGEVGVPVVQPQYPDHRSGAARKSSHHTTKRCGG
jgi:hypothetical protein